MPLAPQVRNELERIAKDEAKRMGHGWYQRRQMARVMTNVIEDGYPMLQRLERGEVRSGEEQAKAEMEADRKQLGGTTDELIDRTMVNLMISVLRDNRFDPLYAVDFAQAVVPKMLAVVRKSQVP
jgi:hypothetical protein